MKQPWPVARTLPCGCLGSNAAIRPMSKDANLAQRSSAEFTGTALLLIIIVGAGIMAEPLAIDTGTKPLLVSALTIGCGLYGLLRALGPVSGAHLNPVISLLAYLRGQLPGGALVAYLAAQSAGAVVGVMISHAMFNLPIWQVSHHLRSSGAQRVGEVIATTGLLLLISVIGQPRPAARSAAIAAYLTGAYWLTTSTSFANPAVTVARALTDTYAGIDPASIPAFLLGQLSSVALCIGVLLLFAKPR
jgi:glycerol uptake facilitator-like aquaporin